MKKEVGFTLVEVIIVIAIVGILVAVVFGAGFRGTTENQAYTAMNSFIQKANISDVDRATCAGDSDGDGYGSCTVVRKSGEKIFLMCPVGLSLLTGAESCKEVPFFTGQGSYFYGR